MSKEALNSEVKSITRKAFFDAWFNEDVAHEKVHEKDSEGEVATVVVLVDGNYYQAETYLAYGSPTHAKARSGVTTDPVLVFPKQKVITVYEPVVMTVFEPLGGE